MCIIQVTNKSGMLGYPKRIYQFRELKGVDTYTNGECISLYSKVLHEIIGEF